MRVSVIPNDKIIIIDGNGIELENWPFDDGHIHAIQWMHDKGHIELKTNEPNIEIDDISFVQPYIDAYTKTLPSIKEKALKAKEEERLRKEREQKEQEKYLEEKRKEQERIDNLVQQNKKIREEKLRLEEETSSLIEEINNTKLHYDIELERKELEKQAEMQVLKNNAMVRELIEKDTNIIKNYDDLRNQIKEEIETSKKEQEKFLELILQHQNNIEIEKKNLEETKKLLNEQIEIEKKRLESERRLIEDQNQEYKYKLDYEKDVANLMKSELDLEYEKLMRERELFEKDLEKKQQELELDKFEISQEKSNIQIQRDLLDDQKVLNKKEEFELLSELRNEYGDKVEEVYEKIESTNKQIKEKVISGLDYDNITVEDLVNIMDELDPNEVYKSLTSGEINNNDFPVEKAVAWFSALKKAMNKK